MKRNHLLLAGTIGLTLALLAGYQNCAQKGFQSLTAAGESSSIDFEFQESHRPTTNPHTNALTLQSPIRDLTMDVTGTITVPPTGTPTMDLTIKLRLEMVDSFTNLSNIDREIMFRPLFDQIQNRGGPSSAVDSLAIALTGTDISQDPYILSELLSPTLTNPMGTPVPPFTSVGCPEDGVGKSKCWVYQGQGMELPQFSISGNQARFFNDRSTQRLKVVMRVTGRQTYQESVFEARTTTDIAVIRPQPRAPDNCPEHALIVNPIGHRRNLVDSSSGGIPICAAEAESYLYVKNSLSGFTDDIAAHLAIHADGSSEIRRPVAPLPLNADVTEDQADLAQILSEVRGMVPPSFAACLQNNPNTRVYPVHLAGQAYNASGTNTRGVLFIRNPGASATYTPPGKISSGWVERATLRRADGLRSEITVISTSPIKLDDTNHELDCRLYPLVLDQGAAVNGRDSVTKDYDGVSWLVDRCKIGLTPYNFREDTLAKQADGYFSCSDLPIVPANHCGNVVVGGITTGILKRASFVDDEGVCHEFGCGRCRAATTTSTTLRATTTTTSRTTTTSSTTSTTLRATTTTSTSRTTTTSSTTSTTFRPTTTTSTTLRTSLAGDTNGNGYIDHGNSAEIGKESDGYRCSTLDQEPLQAYLYDTKTGIGYVYGSGTEGYMCWYALTRNGHGNCLDAGRYKNFKYLAWPLSSDWSYRDSGIACCSGQSTPDPNNSYLLKCL